MQEYLLFSIFIIFFFPLILMIVNAILDYHQIKAGGKKPDEKGVSGFRRSTIALTFILIIGIALFHLIAGGVVKEMSGDVVGNILSMLAGVVASIAGFYFGGKVALDSSSEDSTGKSRQTTDEDHESKESQKESLEKTHPQGDSVTV